MSVTILVIRSNTKMNNSMIAFATLRAKLLMLLFATLRAKLLSMGTTIKYFVKSLIIVTAYSFCKSDRGKGPIVSIFTISKIFIGVEVKTKGCLPLRAVNNICTYHL